MSWIEDELSDPEGLDSFMKSEEEFGAYMKKIGCDNPDPDDKYSFSALRILDAILTRRTARWVVGHAVMENDQCTR